MLGCDSYLKYHHIIAKIRNIDKRFHKIYIYLLKFSLFRHIHAEHETGHSPRNPKSFSKLKIVRGGKYEEENDNYNQTRAKNVNHNG